MRSPTGSRCRYNEARYGRSNGFPCGGNVCSNTWTLVRDAVNTWVADQKAAGRTDAQIKAELATFDQWDRYDYDGDGNFNEPDGYIDHFQIVHAGGDQADGDPYPGRGRHLVAPLEGVPDAAADRPAGNLRRRHPDRRHRPLGRATTPSSRRTAGSASSRTSTATTSACRTTTTPPAAATTTTSTGP